MTDMTVRDCDMPKKNSNGKTFNSANEKRSATEPAIEQTKNKNIYINLIHLYCFDYDKYGQ